MCQIFAYTGNAPAQQCIFLSDFFLRGGATGDHCDGWGSAIFTENEWITQHETKPAAQSALAAIVAAYSPASRTVVAHVRKATCGDVVLSNAHPFERRWAGRDWVFCHNGTLEQISRATPAKFKPEGGTDSEIAFCLMLDALYAEFGDVVPDDLADVFRVVEHQAELLRRCGPANFILSDGELVFAHCSTQLHWSSIDNASGRAIVFATEPLRGIGPWIRMIDGEILVVKNGELQISG